MMAAAVLVLLTATSGAWVTQKTAPGDVTSEAISYAGNACVECHRDQEGRLGEMVKLEWAKSVHYGHNVGCEQCHGGDATLTRDQFPTDEEFKKASHATFNAEFLFLRRRGESGIPRGGAAVDATEGEGASYACRACHNWTTETRLGNPHTGEETLTCLFMRYGGVAMSRERGIAYICATCHPETTEKQLGSTHGSRGAPSCLFCHSDGTHAIAPATIEIIDPRPREELGRCSLCHKQVTAQAVAYVRETLEVADKRIKTAGEQYAELESLGYRSLALSEMYGHVHDVRATLRQVQHGCNVREIGELAKSIEHVAKRVAYDHELVLALRDARRMQSKIALGVAGLLLALVSMLLAYRKACGTGTWDRTIRDPMRRALTPPCNAGCPAGNDVLGFIASAVEENYDKALEVLLRTTPFPSVCGRLCAAPCMDACNRRLFDESINIRDLERYAGDHGRWKGTATATRQERVAVVGSGPAGLSATYRLARLGYHITLFERDAEVGGAMRTGIPGYRLPTAVLDREIARILEYKGQDGPLVEVRTECSIKREDLLRISHEFDALFVATGLQDVRILKLEGVTRGAVQPGIEFLDKARSGAADVKGKDTVVLGGGNVAIDVARTALRLSGAAVRIFCLETRDDMPAHAEEVAEALAEGVEINTGWGLAAIHAGQGRAQRVELRRCLTVFDKQGLFAPTFDEEDRMTVDADVVVIALGQAADLSILPEGARVYEGRALLGFTGAPVFVGGDFTSSEGTVAAATGSGRRAAWHIHKTLTGEDLFSEEAPPIAIPEDVKMHLFSHSPRRRGRVLPPEARHTGFAEVNLGLDHDDGSNPALAEAKRCFSCGVCNQCDSCQAHCPEGIITREGDSYRIEYDYCRGCGTCASECPRGVIHMVEW